MGKSKISKQDGNDTLEGNGKKKERSPNFPVIDLETAIDRIEKIKVKDGKNEVPITLIHDRWDLAKMSGVLQQTVAALFSYGLVTVSGSGEKRRIKISDAGHRILARTTDSAMLLKEAALSPPIFREIWNKYAGELPQDDIIKEYLVFDREGGRFNEVGAVKVIDRFRKTIQFSKLVVGDTIEVEEEAEGQTASAPETAVRPDFFSGFFGRHAPPPPPPPRKEKEKMQPQPLTLPLPIPGLQASLQTPLGIGKLNFEKMKKSVITLLELYKDEIIGSETEQKEQSPDSSIAS